MSIKNFNRANLKDIYIVDRFEKGYHIRHLSTFLVKQRGQSSTGTFCSHLYILVGLLEMKATLRDQERAQRL